MLENLARQAARRRGLRDHRLILRRTRAAIGVQLVRRAVRMVLSCIPHLEDAESQLLLRASDVSVRLPHLRIVSLANGEADCLGGASVVPSVRRDDNASANAEN